eukprot:3910191-Amphidinium_carterae.1
MRPDERTDTQTDLDTQRHHLYHGMPTAQRSLSRLRQTTAGLARSGCVADTARATSLFFFAPAACCVTVARTRH